MYLLFLHLGQGKLFPILLFIRGNSPHVLLSFVMQKNHYLTYKILLTFQVSFSFFLIQNVLVNSTSKQAHLWYPVEHEYSHNQKVKLDHKMCSVFITCWPKHHHWKRKVNFSQHKRLPNTPAIHQPTYGIPGLFQPGNMLQLLLQN